MRSACVIGSPVAHSLSPKLHRYWLNEYGLNGAYECIDVAPDKLEAFMQGMPAQFVGCNVTLPHKEKIMAYLDDIDAVAKRIGAVNTVVIEDGKRKGRNTDAFGFHQALIHGAPDLRKNHAVILGAGGAARAVVVALKDMGFARLTITNRSEDKAIRLAQEFGAHSEPWDVRETLLHDADLLVNCTSLGLAGSEPLSLSLAALAGDAVVCDIVYKPLLTTLLSEAQARGNRVVDGLGMLMWQAADAFEAWFGVKPQVTHALKEYLAAP